MHLRFRVDADRPSVMPSSDRHLVRGMSTLGSQLGSKLAALPEGSIGVATRVLVSVRTRVVGAMRGMAALCTQILGDLGALCEGAVGVAARVVVAGGVGVARAVRGVTTFGSNLPKLVLGQVGEVCGVGRGHCERCCEVGVDARV